MARSVRLPISNIYADKDRPNGSNNGRRIYTERRCASASGRTFWPRSRRPLENPWRNGRGRIAWAAPYYAHFQENEDGALSSSQTTALVGCRFYGREASRGTGIPQVGPYRVTPRTRAFAQPQRPMEVAGGFPYGTPLRCP